MGGWQDARTPGVMDPAVCPSAPDPVQGGVPKVPDPVVLEPMASIRNGWFCGPALWAPPWATVVEAVVSQGNARPGHPAVVTESRTWTYDRLLQQAWMIAGDLQDAGVRPGGRVGVALDASPEAIAACLGAMLVRAAYVPISPRQGARDLREAVSHAGLSCIVCAPQQVAAARLGGVLVVPVQPVTDPPRRSQGAEPGPRPDLTAHAAMTRSAAEATLAYVLMTSGSQGRPKGVRVNHATLAASTAARIQVYGAVERFLMVSPLTFDSSVAGIWGTLAAGGTVVLPEPGTQADPHRLLGLIRHAGVTHLLCIPSLYRTLLSASTHDPATGPGTETGAGSLRCVIVAGEPAPPVLAAEHAASAWSQAALVNEYGPTEATVWSSYARLRPAAPVTIGYPIPGTWVLVDASGGDAPPATLQGSVTGELVIAGAGVAAGYDGAEPGFATLPGPEAAPVRVFRTGDLVRAASDGCLTFLGRLDQQVKVRGQKVDLLAIENEAVRFGAARAAAVFDPGLGQLGLFLETADRIDEQALRVRLRGTLGDAPV